MSSSALASTYTINLYDSWGDGWNGNSLSVVDGDGNELGPFTILTGSSRSVSVTADCITVSYNPDGSFQYETSYEVSDSSGVVLYSGDYLSTPWTDCVTGDDDDDDTGETTYTINLYD
ncbi:MAG TPA: hypothetical protein DIU15_17655, partial [Deltaproteobacteria bacterium]|nr:hypothetical protein [Deltaproteobacteria bacterium]